MLLTKRSAYRTFDPSKSVTTDAQYWERVDAVIASASAKFSAFLGRYIQEDEYTDTLSIPSGTGLERIRLRGFPIVSITSVLIEGRPLSAASYRLNEERGTLVFTPAIHRCEVLYPSVAIKIAYIGGMAESTDDFLTKYPDIVAELHAQVRFELSRIANIAETSVASEGSRTELAPYDLIPSAKRILSKYAAKRGVY